MAHRPRTSARVLPGLPRALSNIAGKIAIHARPLLLAHRAMLLSLTLDTRDHTAALAPRLWDARCLPAAMQTLIPGAPLARSFEAAADAARLVLAELARRCPTYAVPAALGIFTDGTGVAFSSDHPSPTSPNWLARHQAGLCPTTILHSFDQTGAWALLTAPIAGTALH